MTISRLLFWVAAFVLVLAALAVLLFLALFFAMPEETAASEDCGEIFLEIAPEAPACGFALADTGALSWHGHVLADPLVVSYDMSSGDNGTPIPAGKAVLFPASPDGRFRVVQACEGPKPTALCWSVFVLDEETRRLHETTAGKYGPQEWQSWSPDRQHVALLSTTEGSWWLHVIEATSGESHAFPGYTTGESWYARPENITWTGPRTLTATVVRCEGCVAVEEQIQF